MIVENILFTTINELSRQSTQHMYKMKLMKMVDDAMTMSKKNAFFYAATCLCIGLSTISTNCVKIPKKIV